MLDPHAARSRSRSRHAGPATPARALALLAVLALLTTVPGACAAAAVTPITSIATLGAQATSAGATLYSRGEYASHHLAAYDAVLQAVHSAGYALSLVNLGTEWGPDRTRFRYTDDDGDDVTVRVERLTATVTRTEVDVGWFGSAGLGRLFLIQVIEHLPEMRPHVEG